MIYSIIDFVRLGYTIELSPQLGNLELKVKYEGKEEQVWLPYADHCTEDKINKYIFLMIDKLKEY